MKVFRDDFGPWKLLSTIQVYRSGQVKITIPFSNHWDGESNSENSSETEFKEEQYKN